MYKIISKIKEKISYFFVAKFAVGKILKRHAENHRHRKNEKQAT